MCKAVRLKLLLEEVFGESHDIVELYLTYLMESKREARSIEYPEIDDPQYKVVSDTFDHFEIVQEKAENCLMTSHFLTMLLRVGEPEATYYKRLLANVKILKLKCYEHFGPEGYFTKWSRTKLAGVIAERCQLKITDYSTLELQNQLKNVLKWVQSIEDAVRVDMKEWQDFKVFEPKIELINIDLDWLNVIITKTPMNELNLAVIFHHLQTPFPAHLIM